jgi:hypothetical protein
MRLLRLALALGFVACSTRHPATTEATTRTNSSALSTALSSSNEAIDSATPHSVVVEPKTKEECEKRCNGKWAIHGLSRKESCLCRSEDEGKDCREREDCEGACLFVESRYEVVDAGPPLRGAFIGRCSEFVRLVGCKRVLSSGAKAKGPIDLSQRPPVLCVD